MKQFALYLKLMLRKKKQELKKTQKNNWKDLLLGLFAINSTKHHLPLLALEVILQIFNFLQILKFPTDHQNPLWKDTFTPMFSYLDPIFYATSLTLTAKQTLLIVSVVLMNLFWISQVIIFVLVENHSYWVTMTRKVAFLVCRHLLLLPFFRLWLGLNRSCQENSPLQFCISSASLQITVLFIFSFLVFSLWLGLQTYFNFQFLIIDSKSHYVRLRKGAYSQLAFFIYFVLAEVVTGMTVSTSVGQLAILNALTLLLVVVVLWKDEHMNERAKLLEFGLLGVLSCGFVLTDLIKLTGLRVETQAFLLLGAALIVGILQLRTYSIRFELQNINKWPSPQIQIRQTSSLRYYLSRGKEYLFKVWIHGYMQIHRHKCDNICCPSRRPLSEHDELMLSWTDNPVQNQQLIRIKNIMKDIYAAGYRLKPISADIQLQFCIYCEERKQYELALRKLLLLDSDRLPLDKYYMYFFLKKLLTSRVTGKDQGQFLDIIAGMALEKQEMSIMELFQQIALINLEFWNVLNDDHPDLQKLEEVSTARMALASSIQKLFTKISSYTHSQKITMIYCSYLLFLQNEEKSQTQLEKEVSECFRFQQKIVVKDWSHSSSNVFLVSLEEDRYGEILDASTQGAALLGYEKEELISESIKKLYHFELKHHFIELLRTDNNETRVLLLHKSAYLVLAAKSAKAYHSITKGSTALVFFEPVVEPQNGCLLVSSTERILMFSSSLISIFDLDLKEYGGNLLISHFFSPRLLNSNNSLLKIKDMLQGGLLPPQSAMKSLYSVSIQEHYEFRIVDIKLNDDFNQKQKKKYKFDPIQSESNFQFQFQTNFKEFKYFGGRSNKHIPFFSGSNQLSELAEKSIKHLSRPNYAQNISTLRLRNNAIQLIQQEQEEQHDYILERQEEDQSDHALISIPKKDEEEIFGSKKQFIKFVSKGSKDGYMYLFLVIVFLLALSLSLVCFGIQNNQASEYQALTSQSLYQNLIIATLTQQARYIDELKLIALNKSSLDVVDIIEEFDQNLAALIEIQLKGSSPQLITVTVQNVSSTYLTSQYLSTIINYATSFSFNIKKVSTISDLQTALNSTDSYTIDYLLSPKTIKEILIDLIDNRLAAMIGGRTQNVSHLSTAFSVAVTILVLIGIVMAVGLRTLNRQKIKVFSIFLQLSEQEIQTFLSKSQAFLISLNEEQNGPDSQNVSLQSKKKESSLVLDKKKSFKDIKNSMGLYLKAWSVLILMIGFFIQSYVVWIDYIAFQSASIKYFALSSRIEYYQANTAQTLASYSLEGQLFDPYALANNLRIHFREYETYHDLSFGSKNDFSNFYQSLWTGDICTGIQTSYGFVSIPQSCSLPDLCNNGTSLILADLLDKIQHWGESKPETQQIHVEFEVLSDSQRLIYEKLVTAEEQYVSEAKGQLVSNLIGWTMASVLAALLLWVRQLHFVLGQMRDMRAILSILPLSFAKRIPAFMRFTKSILRSQQDS